jgi:hypothetical protein
MSETKVFKELSKVVLVDAGKFKALPASLIQETLEAIAKTGKSPSFVESFASINRKSLLPALAKGEDISVQLEFLRETPLTTVEQAVFDQFTSSLTKVKDIIGLLPSPAYPFATVPEGKTLENYLTVTSNRIYKKGNSNYAMGYKSAEKVWLKASKEWVRDLRDYGAAQQLGATFSSPGGYHTVRVYKNTIQIGCQEFTRWQVEQLAVKMGWEFPQD